MKKNKKQGGYTIIETMIAVSLFLVIVMAGMGALLNANLLHQKSKDMRSVMDNLSFIMEDLSKNLRTGYNYHCIVDIADLSDDPSDLSQPSNGVDCQGIVFEQQNGFVNILNDQWAYFIDNGRIIKSVGGNYSQIYSSFYVRLTPDEVSINLAKSGFSVFGAEKNDSQQPFVTIILTGEITLKGIKTPFSLQTSVSQRKLDFNTN